MRREIPDKTTYAGSGRLATTLWGLVHAAGQEDGTRSVRALETLCQTYWYPLYLYARRHGQDRDQAQDITQGFFEHMLRTAWLTKADAQRGRFRSFLLKSFERFIRGEWDRTRAARRGGGASPLSIDVEDAESRYRIEPADERDAEKLFNRRWAVMLVEQTLQGLEAEFSGAGKAGDFAEMKPFLLGESDDATCLTLAARLRVTHGAARVALHRLRQRYRELFVEAVAQTVETREDLQRELEDLFRVLSS